MSLAPAGFRPAWWAEGQAHLRRDPAMAALMDRYPQSMLVTRGAACETLIRSVVGQQISVKAAAAIWGRFVALVGEPLRPEVVLEQGDDVLRAVGLSFQKIRYIRGIAQGFVDGTVRPSGWDDVSDEEIIRELVALPGIGRWTAEMFLIFHLARPDVLPLDDLGLLKGYELAYGPVKEAADLTGMKRWKKVMGPLAEQGKLWTPYRSLATWYLWRSLDPEEVIY